MQRENPQAKTLPQGVPDEVTKMIMTDYREFSRLMNELNRRDEEVARERHNEQMDAIRHVIDEVRDIKDMHKRTTDAA